MSIGNSSGNPLPRISLFFFCLFNLWFLSLLSLIELINCWIINRLLVLCSLISSQYLSELLAEHQKFGPFMQVLPICSRLLNQGIVLLWILGVLDVLLVFLSCLIVVEMCICVFRSGQLVDFELLNSDCSLCPRVWLLNCAYVSDGSFLSHSWLGF